nr:immunoglobulin heavy chain junction region [Macaca mulatta]
CARARTRMIAITVYDYW